MFGSFKFYAVIACIALGLGGLWGLHHAVYEDGLGAGEKKGISEMQDKVTELTAERDALTVDKTNLKAAAAEATARAAAAEADAQRKLAEAAQVMKKLAGESLQAQASLAAWKQKLSAATTSSDCAAVAKAQICSALSDY